MIVDISVYGIVKGLRFISEGFLSIFCQLICFVSTSFQMGFLSNQQYWHFLYCFDLIKKRISCWIVYEIVEIQGVSHWRLQSKLALTGRRIDNFSELWCLVASEGSYVCHIFENWLIKLKCANILKPLGTIIY